MVNWEEIVHYMSSMEGEEIRQENIIELPMNNAAGDSNLLHVYAARTSKHSYIVHVYANGEVRVHHH